MIDTQTAEKGIRDYLRDYEHASPDLSMIVRLSWLRDIFSTIDALRASYEERGRVIEALAKGERPTCETCANQVNAYNAADPFCGLTRMTDGIHPTVTVVKCRFLGNGCYAYTPKGGAK